MTRICRTLVGALALSMLTAVPSWAASIQIGDPITIQLLDNGIGYPDPLTDNVFVIAGQEIFEGNGSNIGGTAGSGPMLDGEFINVNTTSIVFSLMGGAVEISPGVTTTGYGPGARYVISGLVNPALGSITGGSVVLNNVTGVTVGAQALFAPHSVTLFIDTLGIVFDGQDNLGTVTMNLSFQDVTTPPGNGVVPEPATILLLGSGVAIAWMRRNRVRVM